ncbi:efflux RND transporter periplasmic adaptor subunit [Gemmata sp. JC717]|uniref:Efflux RND transporter periplasmic adaptor subunit n=1 Tax=Gemmata algarum TaxID=2975278 RepID=A0ABU5ERQ5_9BACT|nr:efflux RND transporter periplasmic adaptor subunit [Gemmata algarum]MDY3553706.1 efflux RND transporter periplasmic adaptor subunit [Gemmata algarum]MDY3557663.1 efflux RND transporter periplasmic adaptor subunit [Gemmata algarum]
MRLVRATLVLALGLAVTVLAGCGKGATPLPEPEPPTVAVLKPTHASYGPTKEFTGRLVTKDPVTVIPQVSGKIIKREFTDDGPLVQKGQKLFTIDSTLFRADVEKAKSDIAKAKADIANWTAQIDRDRAEHDRVKQQIEKGVGFRSDLDKAAASVKVSEAQLDVSKATLDASNSSLTKAQENLSYCTVTAPTTGRLRRALVAEGALVDAYKTQLVMISPVDPIDAVWEVDELTSIWYRDQILAGAIKDPRNPATPLTCTIRLKGDKGFDTKDPTRNSTVNYVDPEIVRGTATRTISATFTNKAVGGITYLSGGDSVRVRVAAGSPRQVLAVPEGVVFTQQRKQYVYVVADGKAALREVELGDAFDGQLEVRAGLTTSDTVIADNLLRVRPGIPVTVKP